MASACVNNIGVPPENFLDCPSSFPSFGWLSPRVSLDSKISKPSTTKTPDLDSPEIDSTGDFEFRLDLPVTMLPADELFSDGKLVPLSVKQPQSTEVEEVQSPETAKSCREIDGGDPYLFSPRVPRCSSRWRELLGLKKKQETVPKTTSSSSLTTSAKSIRLFLHRNAKTTSSGNSDGSLTLPLLKDTECCPTCDSLSISSSRLSLSSTSSSGHDHDDLPRFSLDTDKPSRVANPNHTRVRMRPTQRVGRSPMRRAHQEPQPKGVSVDSPRMNPSGKVVFQSLERSSSSPSSFNGGRPRYHHTRSIERSYSANVVRVTPVLNVPVCSLRGSSKPGVFGFGQLFSSQSQKKDQNGAVSTSTCRNQPRHTTNKNKKEGL